MTIVNILQPHEVTISLVHSMLGAVTTDLRAVYFEIESTVIHLFFVVYGVTDEVVEEIEEIVCGFESQQAGAVPIKAHTLVSPRDEPLAIAGSGMTHFVFLRK